MAGILQRQLSLGSPMGIVSIILAITVGLFVLSQFELTRRLTGLTGRGELPI